LIPPPSLIEPSPHTVPIEGTVRAVSCCALALTALFGVAGRFAAVAAFLMVLLFVLVSPTLPQSDASVTSSEITGATTTALPQASQEENGSKPALAEFRGVLAAAPASKSAAPEQPPQLLRQFLQRSQKANSTETSQ
jgi:hypothetical protein